MAFTVNESMRHEGEPIKGSRFIVDIAPIADEAQARQHLAMVAADYPDASHHCSAWRIAEPMIERSNDDGEPGGSAGRPILAQIAGRDLVDIAIIVTRYFGGTKLGVGGLMRAYGGAAGAALDTMNLMPWIATTNVVFEHEYSLTDHVEHAANAASGSIIERSFGQVVTVQVQLPDHAVDAFCETIADLTAGAVIPKRDKPLPQ